MISDRIRQVRNELGLTRVEFGERIGVSRDVINNLELGRLKRPDQKGLLYKLMCKEYGISEQWLQTGEGQMFENLRQFTNQIPQEQSEKALMQKNDILASLADDFKNKLVTILVSLDESDWGVLVNKAVDLANHHKNQPS